MPTATHTDHTIDKVPPDVIAAVAVSLPHAARPVQEPTAAVPNPEHHAEGVCPPTPEPAKAPESSRAVSPGGDTTSMPLGIRLRLVIEKKLEAGTATLRRSSTGETRLTAAGSPRIAAVDAPLLDQQSKAWMAALAWEHFQEMPKSGDLNRLTFALLGRTPTVDATEPSDDELLDELRRNPVAEAVLALFDHPSTTDSMWKGTMADLYRQLQEKAVPLLSSAPAFPRSASILSRHLRRPKTINLLGAFGVTLDMRRSNGSRVCLSSKSDGNTVVPTRTLSVDDSLDQSKDGKDDMDGKQCTESEKEELNRLIDGAGVRKANHKKGTSHD